MSNNPFFQPNMSSDEIYLGQDMEICVTDEINGKADINHTHSEYVSSTELQTLEDIISTKADSAHTHTEYASSSHSHDNYATVVALDTLSVEVDGKANASHTHTEYAESSHIHDEYALTSHSHSGYASASHTHDNYASSAHAHSEYSTVGHDHDDDYAAIDHAHSNYATTTALNEVSVAVSGKANTSHSHDDTYYTETEVDTLLSGKAASSHTHTGVYDASGAAASALTSANAYTDSKIDALVGEGASTTLDTIGEISSAIEDNQDAIDLLNAAIANKANAADLTSHTGNTAIHVSQSDKDKLDGIAEGANNYVLPSAGSSLGGVKTGGDVTISSGVITVNDDSHNHVISNVDGLQSALDGKAASGHNHDSVYYTETEVDTLLSGKANTSHTHTIANVTDLQSALDGKAATSHGTHVSFSTTAPVMDGTASVGTASTVARSDHKHPTDTSRASQTSLDSHTSNTSNPHGVTLAQLGITATAAELNALDGIIATVTELNYVDGVTSNIQTQLNGKAASSHTHSYAGSSSAGGAATSANKLNTNAGSATQPVYFTNGIPVACTYTLGKSVPSDAVFTDTTYGIATTSANGLMSASDKSKLDGMALATVSEVETYLAI